MIPDSEVKISRSSTTTMSLSINSDEMEKGSSKFNSKVIYREEYSMHFQVKSAFYRYLEFTLSCRV